MKQVGLSFLLSSVKLCRKQMERNNFKRCGLRISFLLEMAFTLRAKATVNKAKSGLLGAFYRYLVRPQTKLCFTIKSTAALWRKNAFLTVRLCVLTSSTVVIDSWELYFVVGRVEFVFLRQCGVEEIHCQGLRSATRNDIGLVRVAAEVKKNCILLEIYAIN